jgi:CrcB protein
MHKNAASRFDALAATNETMRLFCVCIGGAIGSGARYLVSTWMLATFGPAFPYGTLTVNIAGSFVLAALMQIATMTDRIPPTAFLMLTTGVLGGFTTYSAFSYESFRYLQEGAWALAASYIVTTVVGCLAACAAGIMAARSFIGG